MGQCYNGGFFKFLLGGWWAHGARIKYFGEGLVRGREVWVILLCENNVCLYPTWHAFVWKVKTQINQFRM